MKKFKRLGSLISLSELKEKEAIKSMVEVRKQKIIEEQKLEQLEAFRKQYLESTQQSEQSGISVSRMLESRTFMDMISKAIREQETRISTVENQIQTRNGEWTRSRHDRMRFEKLKHKEIRNHARFLDKREQNEIDDRCGKKQDPLNR